MIRKLAALSVLTAMALVLFAGSSLAGEKNYRIAFIVKSLQSPFFLSMIEGAEQCDRDFGEITVDVLAPQTPYNIDEQIQLVEQSITNKVDAIVITPADSVGIVPAIQKANAAGIPVVTPNTKAAGGKILSFVGVENYNVGYDLAVALCEAMGGKGNVLLMEGRPGNSTSEERVAGAKDAFAIFPDIVVLDSQPGDWERAKGMTVMENWLQTYDDINGLLTLTNDMGLGALEAIKAAGLEHDILSVTFDLDEYVEAALMAGEIYGTGNQNEKSQAYIGIATALFHLKGYSVDNNQLLPISIITKEKLLQK